jgi:hypothetical protein
MTVSGASRPAASTTPMLGLLCQPCARVADGRSRGRFVQVGSHASQRVRCPRVSWPSFTDRKVTACLRPGFVYGVAATPRRSSEHDRERRACLTGSTSKKTHRQPGDVLGGDLRANSGHSAAILATRRSRPHASSTASARSSPSATQQNAPAASMAAMVASCASVGRPPSALSSIA